MQILQLANVEMYKPQLADLLINCVEAGSSVGFLPPLNMGDANKYWDLVFCEVESGNRYLFVMIDGALVVGTVQLSTTSKKNGLHRAEVEKLMVHTEHRGSGIAKRLMLQIEDFALTKGRNLLVLDTRLGDVASNLYHKLEYIEAGQIPRFALSANGKLETTVYFYKELPTN